MIVRGRVELIVEQLTQGSLGCPTCYSKDNHLFQQSLIYVLVEILVCLVYLVCPSLCARAAEVYHIKKLSTALGMSEKLETEAQSCVVSADNESL